MKNNVSSGILTSKYPNRLSLITKNSSKKIKLDNNKKLRNRTSNFFSFNSNNLPNININDNNILPEEKENNKMKISFASTFYSTNSNKQNIKLPKTNTLLNYKQFNIYKTKSYSKYKKKIRNKTIFFRN